MARHRHQQLMRLLRNQPRSAETTPHSASSTTKLQRRQYGMMTQRRRQRFNRLRTTLPSHDQLQKRAVLSAHRTTDVITRDSNTFNGRRFDDHLCDTSLVDTLLVVNPSLRHVTRRHVTRRQPIFATCHSSTRHSSSTHCQRRYNSVDATLRSGEPPSVPGRSLFDRLVPISSSRCSPHHDDHRFNDCSMIHQPYPRSHPSNKTSPSSQAPGFAPPARGWSHVAPQCDANIINATACIAELTTNDK